MEHTTSSSRLFTSTANSFFYPPDPRAPEIFLGESDQERSIRQPVTTEREVDAPINIESLSHCWEQVSLTAAPFTSLPKGCTISDEFLLEVSSLQDATLNK